MVSGKRFFLTGLVKFEGEKLPAILNAIETENNGQKLVLEVAVCYSCLLFLVFLDQIANVNTATHG